MTSKTSVVYHNVCWNSARQGDQQNPGPCGEHSGARGRLACRVCRMSVYRNYGTDGKLARTVGSVL